MKRPTPPKLALRFFRWFCHPEFRDDIEGDLHERFQTNLKNKSLRASRFSFILETLRLLRPGIIRPAGGYKKYNQFGLIRHYLLTGSRVLFKERTYSLLNVLGLGISMAATFFILQYVEYERNFDKFHTDHERLYRIITSYSRSDESERSLATSPPSLAPLLKEKVPEIEAFVRLYRYPWDLTIAHKDVKFRETGVLFVEPEFLTQFNFKLIQGNVRSCLSKVRTIVITERAAKRYFKGMNPIGKLVTVDGASVDYEITGIVENPPKNSHINFDFLISYETIDWWWDGEAKMSWDFLEFYSYIKLHPQSTLTSFVEKSNKIYNKARGSFNLEAGIRQHFEFQPVSSIHLGPALENELLDNKRGDNAITTMLYGIAWFILVIAWINYINLAISRSMKQSTTIGIRKIIGAQTGQLMIQHMIEALIINSLALIIAIGLLLSCFDFFFDSTSMSVSADFFTQISFWQKSIFIVIIGSIVSGLYPAYLVSSHRVHTLMNKKNSSLKHRGSLRKILVIFQFTLSVSLIAATLIVFKQLSFMKDSDLGFDMTNVMVIKGPNHTSEDSDSLMQAQFDILLTTLKNQSNVLSATSGATTPGQLLYDAVRVRKAGDDLSTFQSFNYTWVSEDYFKTFDIPILAGRRFRADMNEGKSVIINRTASQQLQFKSVTDAIGQKLVLGNSYSSKVIAVIEDFNQESLHKKISPMVIDYSEAPTIYYAIKFSGNYQSAIQTAESIYHSVYPSDPFDFYFLDGYYNRQYAREDYMSKVILLFAVVAIVIACLGLFGLASYNVLQRTKEIGIRKVLGSTKRALIFLFSKEYFYLIVASNLIACPMVLIFMSDWLNGYAHRISINYVVFLQVGAIVLILALINISSIIFKMVDSNPIHALRNE